MTAAGPEFDAATVGSLRRKVITMPARLVSSGRRRRLRAPTNWPWRHAVERALAVVAAIPAPG